MSDLVGSPEDWFSQVVAHIMLSFLMRKPVLKFTGDMPNDDISPRG